MMDLLNVDLNAVRNGKVKRSDKVEPLLGLNYRGLLDAATNVPVAGDVLSGGLALYDAAKGDYGSAALNAISVLPFLSAGMIKKAGKVADAVNTPKLTEFEQRHLVAQRNAALPVEQGGLGLPPNNTAMDRARAMGFDAPAYHGTSKDFNEFNANGGSGKTHGSGAFFTENPAVASTYASRDGGLVMPTMLRLESPVNVETNGANWNWIKSSAKVDAPKITVDDIEGDMLMRELFGDETKTQITRKPFKKTVGKLFPDDFRYDDHISTDDLARWGKSQGYDSMIFNSVKDRGPNGIFHTEEAALPSKNIAVFDPSRIRSRFAAFDPMRRHEADLLGYADPRLLGAIAGGGLLGLGGYSLLGE